MVSNQTLMHASRGLMEIKGRKGVPFGGLSVIIVGDFYQLPPVKAPFLFQSPSSVWRQELFKSKPLNFNPLDGN